MGKSAPSPPTPPDPNVTAAAQAKYNQQTAEYQSQLNNYDVNNPFGSVGWVQDPTTHQWTQTTQLSPAEQAIFAQQTANMGQAQGIAGNQLNNVASALATPFNPSNYGNETYGFGSSPIQMGLPGAGPIQSSFAPGQQVQGQVGPQNFGQAVQNAGQAAYNTETQYLNPQWQQATEHEQAQLAAQGLNPNDAAYQNAMQIFGNQQNQAYQGAMNAAVTAGNQEQQALFGEQLGQGQFANQAAAQEYAQNLGQGQFANQAQAQGFGQNLGAGQFANTAQGQLYGQQMGQANLNNQAQQQAYQQGAYAQELPINEFTALLGTGQVNAPQGQFTPTQVQPTDYLGAEALYQQQLNANYQAQLQQQSGMLGGLFGLGSSLLGAAGNAGGFGALFASDARVKTDIERIADGPGYGVYSFRYRGHPQRHVGVLAQELARVRPDAVHDAGGLLYVDYGAL